MGFFSSKGEHVHVAMDVGSDSIKTVIFQYPSSGSAPVGIKKIITPLKPDYNAHRIVTLLHEVIFSIVKDTEKAPEHILIGLGSTLVESSLQVWNGGADNMRKSFASTDVRNHFRTLFDTHRDPARACLGHPLEIMANGYPVSMEELSRQSRMTIRELGFTTLLICFENSIGPAVAQLRGMFGGISIEFVPLLVAYKEAITRGLGLSDVFIIDVGGDCTLLMSVRGSRLVHFVFFPVGAHHFDHHLARSRDIPVHEARELKRQYAQGVVSAGEHEDITHILDQQSNEWKSRLIDELDSFYHAGSLPSDIVLTGGGSYIPQIRAGLWSADVRKNFLFAPSPRIRIVDGASFFGGSTMNGLFNGPEDAGLAGIMYYAMYHKPLF